MKKTICLRGALMAVALSLFGDSKAAPLWTQSITLQPGWNAIHIEVDPVATTPATVFAGLPVASVWSRAEPLSSATFVQDQNEVRPGDPGWAVWFPASKPESAIANLFAIQGHHAYLVKLEGASTATLNITGQPAFRPQKWNADSYSLRGFAIDPAAPPTFQNFFRPSSAHFNASGNQLRGVYRLNAAGAWTAVAPGDAMRGGEACWVMTQGASDYDGPLSLDLGPNDHVDFGSIQDRLDITMRNRSSIPLNATVRDVQGGAPLAVRQFNATNGITYSPLPASLPVAAAVGQSKAVSLGVRRSAITSGAYESVLEVKDGIGGRYLVPVTATRQTNALTYAGLWVGNVTVKAVSEANSGTVATNPVTLQVTRTGGSTNPTPVKAEFNFRLLLHVDAAGHARLLKEVVQMFQNGTYTNNAEGKSVAATPGRYVLVTDDRLVSQFQGASVRDGSPVGRRISSAAFDFNFGPTNHVDMAGAFAVNGQLAVSLNIAPNDPTNPYRHKFHPDHDNLDVRFRNYSPEAYAVQRDIALKFASTDPSGASPPSFGYSKMAGTYSETLSGLHKVPVRVEGVFHLDRVSEVASLNQ